MPKFAKIQNQLFRAQSKVRGSVLAILNSPLGLWLLSATLITVGGATITAHQDCVASARSDLTTFQDLSTEIYSRRVRIARATLETSNAIDFLKVLKLTASAVHKEYDGRSLQALISQQERARSKISMITNTKAKLDRVRSEVDSNFTGFFHLYDYMLGINLPDNIFDKSADAFERFQQEARYADAYREIWIDETETSFQPSCSPWRVWVRTFTDDSKNIVQTSGSN
jgi:hypothetical protein